jgi:predicted metal-dependent hydrolase
MITPDKIIRSYRKTLSVSIDCFGRITVRAPMRCSTERIFSFLQEKESWIVRKKAEMTGAGTALPPENLDGYTFSLLGKPCTIRLTDGNKIVFDNENSLLYVPQTNAKARIQKWLKENAKRIFTDLTARFAKEMQTTYKQVSVSSARSRWGSCSADNSIRYTFRLLYAEKALIEYVVIHELAHTKHKNHSPRFWAEVEKYAPDYKGRRKKLKSHGIFMQIF